jgi:hypothetical protein
VDEKQLAEWAEQARLDNSPVGRWATGVNNLIEALKASEARAQAAEARVSSWREIADDLYDALSDATAHLRDFAVQGYFTNPCGVHGAGALTRYEVAWAEAHAEDVAREGEE